MIKHALISVYDKSNLHIVCKIFKKYNIKIISTGSTSSKINEMGYKCLTVSKLTNFKEILEGRVKTLHPSIHASILFDRKKEKHLKEFRQINFPLIEYVIVNLYPFEKIIKNDESYDKCIEMIDIGGPTLLRAAAKNHNSVTPICDPLDYKKLVNNIKLNNGSTDIKFRKKMMKKIFITTSHYDKIISEWICNSPIKKNSIIQNHKKIKLRYGENPHQESFLFKKNKNTFYDNLIQGKELSYNNIRDTEIACECVNDFKKPTSVIVKHCSPCGVASSKNIFNAFLKSQNADPISSFGGIIAINRTMDEKTSKLIVKNFYEIVLAPNFSKKAIKILSSKKNMRLIKTKDIYKNIKIEINKICGGYLTQDKNNIILNKNHIKLLSNYKGTKKQIDDLIFAFKVCKYVKSNAIVLANNEQTVAIGGGQTSRVDATKIALNKIKRNNKTYVAASDGFFPFIDNIKLLKKNNCSAIIQPGGSQNDKKIVSFANKNKMSLYFSKFRFFKH